MMNKGKDFFKTCFDTVAGLEVKNESQAIAKEVVLNEVEDLQQRIDKAIEYINHFSKNSEVKINGLPDCKVFIGDIEQLLEILGGKE